MSGFLLKPAIGASPGVIFGQNTRSLAFFGVIAAEKWPFCRLFEL